MRPKSVLKSFVFLLFSFMILITYNCSRKTIEKDIDLVFDFYNNNRNQSFTKFFNWEIKPRDEQSTTNNIYIAKYQYYHKYNTGKSYKDDFYFSFSFENKNNRETIFDYGNYSDSLLTIYSKIQDIPTKNVQDTLSSLVQDFISLNLESLGAYFGNDSLIVFELRNNISILFSVKRLGKEELLRYQDFIKIDENWYYKIR